MNSFEKYLIITILFATMFTSCRVNDEQNTAIRKLDQQISKLSKEK